MKFCPHCGKQLQFEHAEICTGCGCRVNAVAGRPDRIFAVILIAILAVLCIIALGILQINPFENTVPDSSLSVTWAGMEDWESWQHVASWSGTAVGSCEENGPKIVDGHGEYGTEVNLLAGATESSVWRTFSDPYGDGWNTLTFTGKMSPCDRPDGRWMRIEVNDRVEYEVHATTVPPGNGVVFSIPVQFPRSKTVKVKISNGQDPAWGNTFKMEYYSLRLGRESGSTS